MEHAWSRVKRMHTFGCSVGEVDTVRSCRVAVPLSDERRDFLLVRGHTQRSTTVPRKHDRVARVLEDLLATVLSDIRCKVSGVRSDRMIGSLTHWLSHGKSKHISGAKRECTRRQNKYVTLHTPVSPNTDYNTIPANISS